MPAALAIVLVHYVDIIVSCAHTMPPCRQYSKETIAQIIALRKGGHSIKEVAELTGVGLTTVKTYWSRFKRDNSGDTPSQLPRSGRPRKSSKRAQNIVKRAVESNARVTARQLKESNAGVFHDVSVRTVSRRIHELGYRSHKPVKKPLLTKVQRARRVTFAKKYLTWTEEDWLGVLWSDESTFTVTCNRGGGVYRRSGSDPLDPRYLEQTVKHPDSLMVWSCFTGRGVGTLVVLPKNIKVNQYNYLELLCDHLSDCFDQTQAQVFQQDGARAHTAHSVINWLEDCQVRYINDWPGNSPDISPIENLWQIVKADLQGTDVSSLPKLEAAIRRSWANIPPATLHNLALSLPKRLREVIKRRGKPTKY